MTLMMHMRNMESLADDGRLTALILMMDTVSQKVAGNHMAVVTIWIINGKYELTDDKARGYEEIAGIADRCKLKLAVND